MKGKIALVTGGAGKYGAPIVEGLAEAGAAVVIASRDVAACGAKARELSDQGLAVKADQVDIADGESVSRLRDRILSQFGRIDILVNNAVSRPSLVPGPVGEIWQESLRVNAVGLAVCTNSFIEPMIEQRSGNIVNISSMYGLVAQDPHMYDGTGLPNEPVGDYFFHKAGMINYTRYLAARYAEYNIRVNCISPGGLLADQPEKFQHNYCRRVPLGRMADQDDIKGAVVYLASDASAYVTGHNLVVDGGWTIW